MEPAALADLVAEHRPVVVLAGAGLPAAQGIPAPSPQRAWADERPRMQAIHDAAPGPAHRAIRALQDAGAIDGVISESDDVLLEEAGVRDVVELAGSVRDSICPSCGYSEPLGCLLDMARPVCAACGATLAPGTAPDPGARERGERLARDAGLLLLAGAGEDHPLARSAARAVVVTPDELLALAERR